MRRFAIRYRYALLLVLGLLFGVREANACDNPVYRYALENWASTNFQLLLIADDPLNNQEQAAWRNIEQTASATTNRPNLQLKKLARNELKGELGSLAASLENTQGNVLALVSPDGPLGQQLVWSGPVSEQSLAQLVDSPARQTLAKRLIDGEAVVWVMLETADAAANDQMRNLLDTFLSNYTETLIATEAAEAANPTAAPAGAEVPVKKPVDKSLFWPPRFSTLSITPGDPHEELLVTMLRQTMSGELASEPVVFAVFGRGRILGGLPLSRLNAQLLRSACDFLTGACSCEVKDRNPGDDLLMAAAWESVPKASAPTGLVSLLELEVEPKSTSTAPPPTTETDQPAANVVAEPPSPPTAAAPTAVVTPTETAPVLADEPASIQPSQPAADSAPLPTSQEERTPICRVTGSPVWIFGGILAAIILFGLFGMRR